MYGRPCKADVGREKKFSNENTSIAYNVRKSGAVGDDNKDDFTVEV